MDADKVIQANSGSIAEPSDTKATLRDREDVYRALAELSEDVIAMLCEERFTYINPAGAAILGAANPEELIAKSPRDIMSAADSDFLLKRIRSATDEERLQKFEHTLRAGATKSWFDSSISPVLQNSVLWTAHDVTKYKRLERTPAQSEAQIRQSQKLESIEKWAGEIAHDFNNMLTVINGYSELSLRRLRKDGALRGNIEEIKKAGERSALLTYQLLAFSRQQIINPETVDLNDVIKGIDSMLRRLISKDIRLVTRLDRELWRVNADSGRLSHLVMNLVVNARDAMPRGGTLIIETKNFINGEKFNEFAGRRAAVKHAAYIELTISDSGIDINSATRKHLSDLSYANKAIGLETGLGLATVYDIVKQANGYIFADGKVGEGAIVKVYLPRLEDESELSETFKQNSQKGETILALNAAN